MGVRPSERGADGYLEAVSIRTDQAAGTADPQTGAARTRPSAAGVGTVAVVAHRRKSLGGGLDELRRRLAEEGVGRPLWYEVPKSRKAPKRVRAAVADGADLVLVWGGDGMVQRCLDTLAGSDVAVGIIPAGTANLLASNLGVPEDLAEAVRIALYGRRQRLDLGRLNGEHFPFVRTTRGRRIDVRLAAPVAYEMDGGTRGAARRLKVRVVPGAVTVCLPPAATRRNGRTPPTR